MAKRKSTPAPTLAQLRKLERDKNLLDFDQYHRSNGVRVELWWRGTMTHFCTIYDALEHPAVRRAVFGILSALPDAPSPQRPIGGHHG